MPYRFCAADVAFLASSSGHEALDRAAGLDLSATSLLGDLTGLRRRVGDFAGAVAETVRLRRRAAERWHGDGDAATGAARAGRRYGAWLFTDEALQQAPPPPVAAHRAARIAAWVAETGSPGVQDVTCSVGTDLAALAAAGSSGAPAGAASGSAPSGAARPDRPPASEMLVIGSDLDPVRLAMARHNLRRSGLPARLVLADAGTVTTRALLRYADPARRDSTGRRISSADTVPPVAELDAADPAHPPVLRLPPGIDYPSLGRPGEIEIVSWNGAVREAVAWPPALATARRRATILVGTELAEQLTDAGPDDVPVTAADRYLVDPDPAVVRAHLVRQYAARHHLTLLDEHLAYLTGPTPPRGIRSFEITDAARYSERVVRDWVRRDGVGTLEIKQRGTPVIPDELRRRVRSGGDTRVARTLVIARIGRDSTAFWCRAIPPPAR